MVEYGLHKGSCGLLEYRNKMYTKFSTVNRFHTKQTSHHTISLEMSQRGPTRRTTFGVDFREGVTKIRIHREITLLKLRLIVFIRDF